MTLSGLAGWILSGVLIVVLIFTRQCSGGSAKQAKSDTIRIAGDTKYSVAHDTMWRTPKTVVVYGKGNTSRDTIYVDRVVTLNHTDSVKAVKDYLAVKVYTDSFKSNEVLGVITDSISENSIKYRKVDVKNTRPKMVITPPAKEKNRWLAGGTVGLGLDLKTVVLAPQLSLVTPTTSYQIAYDLFNRMPLFSMGFKIGK